MNKNYKYLNINLLIFNININIWGLGIGDWGLGIGDWANTVKNYIIKYINHNFEGDISDTLSYNSYPNGSINNFLKDRDKIQNLLAIYFDGGYREGRDNYYDYINLRWQGKGSSNMYCFWKSADNIQTLQYNNVIKISHFLNTKPYF